MKVTFMRLADMANVHAVTAFAPAPTTSAKTLGPRPLESKLATATTGQLVRIVRVAQDDEHAAWLRAVGMHEGAEVTVLRRAPFGGPIHLRSTDGGEFAIHRDLARCIDVAPAAPPAAPAVPAELPPSSSQTTGTGA
jgi:ferrous iron transport protein A